MSRPKDNTPGNRLRLTRSGRAFLGVFLLVLLASWNTGANLLYLVSGSLLSFMVLSWVLSGWTLAWLDATREAPHAVHRGESFPVTISASNRKSFSPSISLRIDQGGTQHEVLGYVPKIPPGRTAEIRVSEVFHKRGVHLLPPVQLASGFPFGFLERTRAISDLVEVVVYPRIIPLRAVPLDQFRPQGRARSLVARDGDEFFCLRNYLEGDDIRRIAWRASARLGRLLVRELELGKSRFVVIFFDTRLRDDLEHFEERFEDAVDLVASLGVALLRRQYGVAVVTSSQVLPMGEGPSHVLRMQEMLARVEPVPDSPERPPLDLASIEPDNGAPIHLCVSPDPASWGGWSPFGKAPVIDPREVVLA